jgi:ABC-type glycerol-3-phosphate transport system permease component
MAVRTGTSRRLAARRQAAPQQAAARADRRLPSLRTAIIAAAAYVVAVIFVLPYLEMLITAVRPQRELYEPNYLPHHFAWSNLTNMWGAAFGITSAVRVSLEIAGGATLLVLLVSLPAAYYTSRHRFRGRNVFLLLVLATQMLQPTALIVGIYKEFLGFGLLNLNPVWSLMLVNAGFNLAFAVWILNAYISSIPVELEQAAMVDGSTRLGRVVPGHAAAGHAGRGDRADLHLHRGVERVHLGPGPHHQQRRLPAHGAAGLVHRPVQRGLAAPVRRLRGGHHPGVHPVRPHRGACGGRPHRRLGQVGSLAAVALAHRVVQTRPSRSTM